MEGDFGFWLKKYHLKVSDWEGGISMQLDDDQVGINLSKANTFSLGITVLNCCSASTEFRHLNEPPNKIRFEKEMEEALESH